MTMCLIVLADPVTSAAVALAVFCLLAIAVYYLLRWRTFEGYRPLAPELRRLAASLRAGEIRRKRKNVRVSGAYDKFPVLLEFSNDLESPAVYLRVNARIDVGLSIHPRTAEPGPGAETLSFGDPQIDNRYWVRCDKLMVAQLFLGIRGCREEIKKLCCSRKTRLTLQRGMIEHTEMALPMDPARHLVRHIQSMGTLAELAARIPGSERAIVPPLSRRRLSVVFELSIGCLALLVGWVAFVARKNNNRPGPSAPPDILASRAFRGWHLADAGAFDAGFADWLTRSQVSPASRLVLRTVRQEAKADVYLLAASDGSRRVVISSNGSILYDSRFLRLAGIARVPWDVIASVDWTDAAERPESPDSDALLLVRDAADIGSGRILFIKDGQVHTGAPRNYQQVGLRGG